MNRSPISYCPCTLAHGFSTYSPAGLRLLFDRRKVSHLLDFSSPKMDASVAELFRRNSQGISVSGAQFKQSLTINKKQLAVTADNKSMTFGDAIPELTIQYSGFVNSQTASVLTTAPSAATVATSSSNAGQYAITVSGGEATNYSFSYVSGTLTIGKATASVELSNMSQMVDGTAKSPTVTTTPASLNFTITYNGLSTAPTQVGTYTVVVTIQETNYQGTANGTFEITPDPLSIKKVIGLSAYPNPVRDYLTVETLERATIRLLSLDGKTVWQGHSDQGKITMQGLEAGIYLLEATTDKGTVIEKIVKN